MPGNVEPTSISPIQLQADDQAECEVQELNVQNLLKSEGTQITEEASENGIMEDLTVEDIYENELTSDARTTSQVSPAVRGQLTFIREDIKRRTSAIKNYVTRPLTPDKIEMTADLTERARRQSITDLLGAILPPSPGLPREDTPTDGSSLGRVWHALCKRLPESIDTEGTGYIWWLAVVVLAWVYNAFFIPMRMTYPYQTEENIVVWMCFDYLADCVYLVDMLFVQPRKQGKACRFHYMRSKRLKYDLVSLLPLDIFYLVVGPTAALRLPRIMKYRCYFDLFNLLDGLVSFTVALRILRTVSYMLYMVHCNSCIYYYISMLQAFGQISYWDDHKQARVYNRWVYNNKGNAYIRCFYFTTKLAITIGNNAPPTNVVEYLYMYTSWMVGLFVFAMLLGQIRDIVTNASRNREDFRNHMDAALQFCNTMKVPPETLRRVRSWFIYTWESQKILDETQAIAKLPLKLRKDLAISVHYETLAKVQLFQDCEQALLRDLVLKLQPVLYLPGDYICRKGEVGKEMYIVSRGVLQVVGGENDEKVFVELKAGTVFGEISLLAVGGGNRRTANVRSKGFSNLFLLAKDDLYAALEDYPEAQAILRVKAKQILEKDAAKADEQAAMAQVKAQLESDAVLATGSQMVDPKSQSGFANLVANLIDRSRTQLRHEHHHGKNG